MHVVGLLSHLLEASIVPRVEDPWPHRIGLGFPLEAAGAFGGLAGMLHADSPGERRERAISRAGLIGFKLGAAWYALALAVQIGFR
jgi:hypothetical protein